MYKPILLVAVTCVMGCGEASHPTSAPVLVETVAGRGQGVAPGGEPTQNAVPPNRKVIYRAELDMVVEDFDTIAERVPALVRESGGFLADGTVNRSHGTHRTGRWVARVPVSSYDSFLDAVAALGVPQRRQQTAEDVTEQYVDLSARLSSKQKLEVRILELLDNREGDIKEVVEVERELSRVRTEIEQMEGQLRYLDNRIELTTVTIVAREVQHYVAPQAPGFKNRVASAWSSSLGGLRKFAENGAIAIVAATPWVLVLAIILVPLVVAGRRALQHRLARGRRSA